MADPLVAVRAGDLRRALRRVGATLPTSQRSPNTFGYLRRATSSRSSPRHDLCGDEALERLAQLLRAQKRVGGRDRSDPRPTCNAQGTSGNSSRPIFLGGPGSRTPRRRRASTDASPAVPSTERTVDIKWYGKREGLIDLASHDAPPDYYLVMTGPKGLALTSRGAVRPWCIASVYLFETANLFARLRERSVKIGTATSVAGEYWAAAEIFPESRSPGPRPRRDGKGFAGAVRTGSVELTRRAPRPVDPAGELVPRRGEPSDADGHARRKRRP